MPIGDGRADVVRHITGVTGTVAMRHEWVVRAAYGKVRPWVHRRDVDGLEVIVAVAGPDQLALRGPRLPHAADHPNRDEFEVSTGEETNFSPPPVPPWAHPPNLERR